MSGGEVVSTRGGIDVRTDDLRAAAQILSDVGATVRQDLRELQTKTTSLPSLIYRLDITTGELASGVALARSAADEAARLANSLRDAADSYDNEESWIQRMLGNSFAVAKDASKYYVRSLSGGLLDMPYDWDPRALEAGSWLVDKAGLGQLLAWMAAILDWRRPPVVAANGADTSPAGTTPPRDMTDLLTNVERLGGADDVSVQFLEFDDGRPRQVIVSLPGTTQWIPGSEVTADITAGPLAVQGMPTSYSEGVMRILELAGVTAADEILLVGHSLGGMVAATLAQQLAGSGRFTVTNVVTAGSPIAEIDIPDDIEVIALENKDDPIPYADRGLNEASGNVLTITVDTAASGIHAHYISEGYAPALDAVATSDVPQIEHALESLQPYLEADRATTYTYSITRG